MGTGKNEEIKRGGRGKNESSKEDKCMKGAKIKREEKCRERDGESYRRREKVRRRMSREDE